MKLSSSLLLLLPVVLTSARTFPEDCSGEGTCVPIKTCPSVIKRVKEAVKHGLEGNIGQRKAIVADIRKKVCGDVKQKKICCADNLEEHFTQTTTSVAEIEVVTESAKTTIATEGAIEAAVARFQHVENEPENLTFIGDLVLIQHVLQGTVYAKDSNTIVIRNFVYDGAGPDAFLWAGNSSEPGIEALEDEYVNAVLPYPFEGDFPTYKYEDKDIPILGAFLKPTDIELKLPQHVSVEDFHWISVWCRAFNVNFGYVTLPDNFRLNTATEAPVKKEPNFRLNTATEAPVEQEPKLVPDNFRRNTATQAPVEKEPKLIGDFLHGIHKVGGKVFAKDLNTVVIKGFTYDGAGPDAFLWAGNSTAPDSEALEEDFVNAVLPYPFEGVVPTYKYEDKDIPILGAFHQPTDIELKLPEHVTVEDLHWISVWCRDFQVNFGHVTFPDNFRLD